MTTLKDISTKLVSNLLTNKEKINENKNKINEIEGRGRIIARGRFKITATGSGESVNVTNIVCTDSFNISSVAWRPNPDDNKKARATFLISFETPYSSSEYEPLISVETGGWGGENTGVFDVQPTGFRFDCTTNEVLAVAPRELNIVVFGK
jgi:hypothetical protein